MIGGTCLNFYFFPRVTLIIRLVDGYCITLLWKTIDRSCYCGEYLMAHSWSHVKKFFQIYVFWHCNINIQWNRKYQTWWIDKFKFFPYFHAIWKLLNLKLEKFLISSSEKKEKRKPWRFQIDPTRISLFCINLPRSFIENYEEYAFTRNTSNASYRIEKWKFHRTREKKRKKLYKIILNDPSRTRI